MDCFTAPIFCRPDYPFSLSAKKASPTSTSYTVECPDELAPYVYKAAELILGLAQHIRSEKTQADLARKASAHQKEQQERRQRLFQVYLDYRVDGGRSHTDAVKALLTDARLQDCHELKWELRDYKAVLPKESETRQQVRSLRKALNPTHPSAPRQRGLFGPAEVRP